MARQRLITRLSLEDVRPQMVGALRSLPVYPVVAAAAFVLSTASATSIPKEWLVRPTLTAAAGSAIVTVGFALLTRNRHFGGALAAAAFIALLGLHAVAVVCALAAILLWVARRRVGWASTALSRATNGLNLVSALWFAIAGVSALGTLAPLNRPEPSEPSAYPDPAALPDIYVILLDAYARSDTLAGWGFDNAEFLDGLERRGFYVSPDSKSDYDNTMSTLPSILHMTSLEDLAVDYSVPGPARDRLVWRLVNDTPVVATLEQAGYLTYATVSHSAPAAVRSVDYFLDHGHVTEFEAHLLSSTELDTLLSWVAPTWLPNQQRERVIAAFADVRAIARSDRTAPRFVWAHVLSPHAPFVVRRDGGLMEPVDCYPQSCNLGAGQSDKVPFDEFVSRYTEQVLYVNSEVLRTVDAIVEQQPTAVIVVMSDHGARYDLRSRDEEWFRNFFAARTPGYPRLFGDDPRPRELFQALFRVYPLTDLD